MCGKTHTVWMFFSGRGTPRKFCRECKDFNVTYVDQLDVHGAGLLRLK
jgi:hypothetical protein